MHHKGSQSIAITGFTSPTGWTTSSQSSESEPIDMNIVTVVPAVLPYSNHPLSTTTSIFRQSTLNLRFSGEKGHPINPRHFLKEFRIAMRDLNVVGDRERIQAFEDYLVVDAPAEKWYLDALPTYLDNSWDMFQVGFLLRFPGEKFDAGATELQKIKSVKFRQDAAVSAYIMAKWISDSEEKRQSKLADADCVGVSAREENSSSSPSEESVMKLGTYKPIATEEIFVLANYGIPNGTKVKFSSYVWGVGEYSCNDDQWFIHDTACSKGADFRQSGTAFKGWFNHTGKYDI